MTLFLCLAAAAQLTEGTLKGTVLDTTERMISGAMISTRNDSTGETRRTLTEGGGTFFLPALPPGLYTVTVAAEGFKTYQRSAVRLSVGETTDLAIRMELGSLEERVEVTADAAIVPVKTEGRLSDTLDASRITNLPVPGRDIFSLPRLSAGATAIPGAANSTKLTNSPVITVNGNRYRGNNYVLDGSVNVNPNNTGEPAIVPTLDSIEEAQVQTGNFSSEFGRGNGAVINLRTRSGSNEFHGRLWEYHRNAALNARNFFATQKPPQTFNQFGGNFGGPLIKNRTFFFGSYESTRNALSQPLVFQVETPEYRNYVHTVNPTGVANQLLTQFPAPTPLSAGNGRYIDQVDLKTPAGTIPALGRASVMLSDYIRFDQMLIRLDHSLNEGRDKITARWVSEYQRNNGGTASSRATLGKAIRGSRGPFDGFFGNMNVGETHVFGRAVNDARFSFQDIQTYVGANNAVIPEVTITGITAPFGDIFLNGTRLRSYEFRNTLSMDRGRHLIRAGIEVRRIFKGLSLGPASSGAFTFNNLLDFATDKPFRQTLTVDPNTGAPVGFPRYFTLYETGAFFQDEWRVTSRLNLSLGVRHDYFGTATERDGRLSSIIFGSGANFRERLANASIGRVDQLYSPQKLNFSPRIGFAWDPFGGGHTSVRGGFGIAYQPHHGQSITGARALPPDAVQGVLQPSVGIGSKILYGIPVPINPEFGRGLTPQGGIASRPGEPRIRTTGFVVNPDIKTQYSENWFFNIEHEVAKSWIAEFGYVGTRGINLERIDDVNRFAGDLLDGREDRINPYFSSLLFVTNGVTSDYHAFTAELRHNVGAGLTLQANYRFSKWLDTSSDTSTGQFLDNAEPGKGAMNIDCLRCERGRSMFDIPHRFTVSATWMPQWRNGPRWLRRAANDWQWSTISSAQSGRPFSVWNGAAYSAGGDYNADGGGGAVGGGFYDRPNAPVTAVHQDWSNQDFLNGLFSPTIFSKPAPGASGTLGRNTYRGPRQFNIDVAAARNFRLRERTNFQFRAEAFNVLNTVNLYLPNTDLSLALRSDGTYSSTSSFGKSTAAFDARVIQASLKFIF